jgi:hypothetical protein
MLHDPVTFRGTPRTSEEWAALAKVASGEQNLTKDELRRLFMLGLVDRHLERITLSKHGRAMLAANAPGAFPAGTAPPSNELSARQS